MEDFNAVVRATSTNLHPSKVSIIDRKGVLAMRRQSALALMGLSMIFGYLSSVAARAECEYASSSGHLSDGTRVIEFPSGPVDGNNEVFSLKRGSADPKSLRLFEDGKELKVDLQNSNTISIVPPPSPGVVLLVSYCLDAPKITQPSLTEERRSSLVRQALLESLQADPSGASGSPANQGVHQSNGASQATHGAPGTSPFLSMLSQRMVVTDDRTRPDKMGFGSGPSSLAGMGISGPETVSATSIQSPVPFHLDMETASRQMGGISIPLPRFLKLLQQRMNDAEVQSAKKTSRGSH